MARSRTSESIGGVAMAYNRTIAGNPDDGFTSAELEDASGEFAGRVFQLEAGWYIACPNLDRLEDPEFVAVVLGAREELLHYVNRRGTHLPEGLTPAGASLWLMQRDDGKGFTMASDDAS